MVLQDFQEKKAIEKAAFSLPVLAILLFLAAFAVWGLFKVYANYSVLKKDIRELETKITKHKTDLDLFENKLKILNTASGLEKEARGRFNLKKPGEEVVVFLNEEKPAAAVSGSLGNWIRSAKKWIFGLIFN